MAESLRPRRWLTRAVSPAIAVAILLGTAGCERPSAWVAELYDLDLPVGSQTAMYDMTQSADGTKLLFVSRGGDLGPVDTNGGLDVYVRDLATGTNELV